MEAPSQTLVQHPHLVRRARGQPEAYQIDHEELPST